MAAGIKINWAEVQKVQQAWADASKYYVCVDWHEQFVWSPVITVSGKRLWLRKIWHRKCRHISQPWRELNHYATDQELWELRLGTTPEPEKISHTLPSQ